MPARPLRSGWTVGLTRAAAGGDVRTSRIAESATADKLNDLYFRPSIDRRGTPALAAHDFAVHLDCNPGGFHSQRLQKCLNSKARSDRAALAIYGDVDLRGGGGV